MILRVARLPAAYPTLFALLDQDPRNTLILHISEAPVASATRPRKFKAVRHEWRRPSREKQYDEHVVRRGVPAGSTRISHGSRWMAAMEDSFDLAILSPAVHARLMVTASVLLHNFRPASKTTSPGWDYLVRATGHSRATIGRHLRLLEKLGYLGIVATGRQAGFMPKGSEQKENDRAVYVLCRPKTVTEKAVDNSETLTTSSVESYPPHAHANTSSEGKAQADAATRRRQYIEAAFGRAEGAVVVDRSVAMWPATQRISSAWTKGERRAAELQASLELQRRAFPLRELSAKHLAFVCRDFFAAGWTVRDVLVALDHRPDDRRWQHDGAYGVADVAKWAAYRLAAWRTGLTVHHSPTQREEVRSAQGAAQARAAAERRLQAARDRGTLSAIASRGAAAVREALRAAKASV